MNPNPETKPAEVDAPKPATQTAAPATQISQPTPPAQPTLAEPPQGIEFTEVPDEPQAPVTPGTVTQPVVVTDAPTKKKKPAKTSAKGPGKIIFWALVVFVALAGLAYYAYTKSV